MCAHPRELIEDRPALRARAARSLASSRGLTPLTRGMLRSLTIAMRLRFGTIAVSIRICSAGWSARFPAPLARRSRRVK